MQDRKALLHSSILCDIYDELLPGIGLPVLLGADWLKKKQLLWPLLGGLLVMTPIIASCGNSTPAVTLTPEARQSESQLDTDSLEIWITDKGFIPDTISIFAGETITWINQDSVWHAVQHSFVGDTLGEQPYGESGRMEPGKSYKRTFDVAGIWYFVCPKTAFSGVVFINSSAENE